MGVYGGLPQLVAGVLNGAFVVYLALYPCRSSRSSCGGSWSRTGRARLRRRRSSGRRPNWAARTSSRVSRGSCSATARRRCCRSRSSPASSACSACRRSSRRRAPRSPASALRRAYVAGRDRRPALVGAIAVVGRNPRARRGAHAEPASRSAWGSSRATSIRRRSGTSSRSVGHLRGLPDHDARGDRPRRGARHLARVVHAVPLRGRPDGRRPAPRRWRKESGVPILLRQRSRRMERHRARARRVDKEFNSAFLVRADGTTGGVYRKMHLVPWGEYVPLKDLLFFVGPLVEAIGTRVRGRRRSDAASGRRRTGQRRDLLRSHLPGSRAPVRARAAANC